MLGFRDMNKLTLLMLAFQITVWGIDDNGNMVHE
jgi:hypothetical protein